MVEAGRMGFTQRAHRLGCFKVVAELSCFLMCYTCFCFYCMLFSVWNQHHGVSLIGGKNVVNQPQSSWGLCLVQVSHISVQCVKKKFCIPLKPGWLVMFCMPNAGRFCDLKIHEHSLPCAAGMLLGSDYLNISLLCRFCSSCGPKNSLKA